MSDTSAGSAKAVPAPARLRGEGSVGSVPAPSAGRAWHERPSTRLLATVGIVGVATILGAVLVSQNVAGWIVGLVVGVVAATLAARLWSSGLT